MQNKEVNMEEKKRVIVVEDDIEMLEFFVNGIETLGVEVDKATSKIEALEKINCRSYHVAMVDIMLTDSHSDRGGIEVIDYINSMDEGTKIVVASATSDVTVPADLIKRKIVSYLVKKHHIRKNEDFLIQIRNALSEAKLKILGDCHNLGVYLAAPETLDFWAHSMAHNLGVKIPEVQDCLNDLFKPLLPIIRGKNQFQLIYRDQMKKSIYGQMWSKALGKAVWVSIAHDEKDFILPDKKLLPSMKYKNNQWNLKCSIWCLKGVKRSDYFEKMTKNDLKIDKIKRGEF